MYTQVGVLMIFLYFIADFFPKRTNLFYKKTIIFLLMFLFWWVAGLSYKTGVDNYNYELVYYTGDMKFEYFELGYKLVNKIFNNYLNFDFYIFKGIVYIVTIFLFYKGLKFFLPNNKIGLFFILLYSYGVFYFFYIGFIRQTISISIFTFSLQYIYQKKKVKYIILVIISCMFHISSIFLYLIYFLYNNKRITKK